MPPSSKEDYRRRCDKLEKIIHNIWWMARRYAHGRRTYAVNIFNESIREAQELGLKFTPDSDGLVEAKDPLADKDWYEAQSHNSVKFMFEEGKDPYEK